MGNNNSNQRRPYVEHSNDPIFNQSLQRGSFGSNYPSSNWHHQAFQPNMGSRHIYDTCPRCRGKGWVHDSIMTHNEKHNKKCFFCEDCKACRGMCLKCHGKGWTHKSGITHDKPAEEKCFFCETCKACHGTG